ncbi:TPM domain-containing protein, partial [Kribbia dieselivorans]|uniref:TPM domain-containing protein n=1 Tax=Kribbia dieselivorans TaxID=331526 RepID=UPI000838DB34
ALAGALPAATALAAPSTTHVTVLRSATPATAPLNLKTEITDEAKVLGDRTDEVRTRLDEVRADSGLQLFVVYVKSFDGMTGEEWAQQTFDTSGMGDNDVLLAVAVDDRRYGTWSTSDTGLTAEDLRTVQSENIEPALAKDDWAGAAIAAADGLADAKGGSGIGGSAFPWLLVGIPVVAGGAALIATRRGDRSAKGGAGTSVGGEPPASNEDDLQKSAAHALIDLDDAIRSSGEELNYAEVQFGKAATQRFREALEKARATSTKAFALQQQIDEGSVPAGQRTPLLEQILALATEADQTLDAEVEEFTRMRDLEGRAPEFVAELDRRATEVTTQMPVAEQQLAGLKARYPATTLATVQANVDQSRELLTEATRFLDQGREHIAVGNRTAAVVAARSAEDAIGQAERLLAAVGRAGEDLVNARSLLDAHLASISSDIADAQRLNATDEVTVRLVEAAREAVTVGTAARDGGDPLAAVALLTRAEADLDKALEPARDTETVRTKALAALDERFRIVRARIDSVDDTIRSYRGAVDRDARTAISEAKRLYDEAVAVRSSDLEQAGSLLTQAEAQAQRALDSSKDDLDRWNSGHGRRRGSMGIDPTSLILGGILLGGGRGGGWGGSGGSWGGGGLGGGGGFGGGGFGGGGFGGGGRF